MGIKNLNFAFSLIDILDLFFIITIGFLFFKFIKKTEALKIMIGFLLFLFVFYISGMIGLTRTHYLFERMIYLLGFGMIIVFQPEIRSLLKKIGNIEIFLPKKDKGVMQEIKEAVFSLSRKKVGAILVLDHQKILTHQLENLTYVDAWCRREMLETIFHPTTPLHDGAVIIHHDRIVYAGAKLPLSGKKIKEVENKGTRHLAGFENAMKYNVVIIVVSEETGEISIFKKDQLVKIENEKEFDSFFFEKSIKN